MSYNNCQITIFASKVARFLASIAVILILTSLATQFFKFATGYNQDYGLIPLFNLDDENNIPTFFSVSLLFFAAVLIGLIALLKKKVSDPFTAHWAILAFIFLYLAIDEAASIHELLGRPTRERLGSWAATGAFFFSWVIPGIALVVVLALVYLRFWLHLPLRTRLLTFIAGSLYIGGAIGVEIIGGAYFELYGLDFTYIIIASIEESLEMVGVILFVFALLKYIATSFGELTFHFSTSTRLKESRHKA